MQGATIRHGTYYRCTARTLAPGAAMLIGHPATVNLREDAVLGPLNDWIGFLFARENVDRTVAALAASQGGLGGTSNTREGIKARLTKAEVRLRRLQAAIEAGVDPAALVQGSTKPKQSAPQHKPSWRTRRSRMFSATPRFTR